MRWLGDACAEGERLISTHLDRPPEWYFKQPTNEHVRSLYEKIDGWRAWQSRLIGGLRRRLIDADHLVRHAEERFLPERFLRFRLEKWNHVGAVVGEIDFSERARYVSATGFIDIIHRLEGTRLEPDWQAVSQSLLDDLRNFPVLVAAQIQELALFGEPRDLGMETAIVRLEALRYMGAAAVKADIVAAEDSARQAKWRDAAAAFRRAVERMIDDAYREAASRQPVLAGAQNREAQARALGQGFIDRGTARQAYASFSILSGLGSHAGAPLSDEEGDLVWQAGRLAVALMALRLPA